MVLNGFNKIPILFDAQCHAPHYLFLRKHNRKDESNGRTLFIINIPSYCNEVGLKNIFSDCGRISAVNLVENPGQFEKSELKNIITNYAVKRECTFKFGYLVFEHPDSVETALELSPTVMRYISTQEKPVKVGLEKWISEYSTRYPDESSIQHGADEYMRLFDSKALEEKEAMQNAGEADEDGWVTIPVNKKTVVTKTDNSNGKRINKKLEKKKRKEKELLNFYMFQQREEKRNRIATLRQKFEEDKKRITQMRQSRKFKPF